MIKQYLNGEINHKKERIQLSFNKYIYLQIIYIYPIDK